MLETRAGSKLGEKKSAGLQKCANKFSINEKYHKTLKMLWID